MPLYLASVAKWYRGGGGIRHIDIGKYQGFRVEKVIRGKSLTPGSKGMGNPFKLVAQCDIDIGCGCTQHIAGAHGACHGDRTRVQVGSVNGKSARPYLLVSIEDRICNIGQGFIPTNAFPFSLAALANTF